MLTPTFYNNTRNSMICRGNIKNLMNPYKTKNKPQIKAPRVTPLEGVYTYACGHTWVRSREPAGFRHDERRFNASDLDLSVVIRGQITKRKSKC